MNTLFEGLLEAILAPILNALFSVLSWVFGWLAPVGRAIGALLHILAEVAPVFMSRFLAALAIIYLALILCNGAGLDVFLVPDNVPWTVIVGLALFAIVMLMLAEFMANSWLPTQDSEKQSRRTSPIAVAFMLFVALMAAVALFLGRAQPEQPVVTSTCAPADPDAGVIKRSLGWAKSKVTDC